MKYSLSLVATGCSGANPLLGVRLLQLRVTGDGIANPPTSLIGDVALASTRVYEVAVPVGTNRVIEVRAYDNNPAAGGRVVSIGRMPVTVPGLLPAMPSETELQKRVFLRQVNSWSAPVSATEPSTCQSMKLARAGHTATLLPNGKIFIAGGFNYDQSNLNRQALKETETFDPSTGTFSNSMGLNFITRDQVKNFVSKAFHTATLLNDGRVLLWGGERYQLLSGVNVVAPTTEVLVYDAESDSFLLYQRSAPPQIPRTQHRAVMDKNGKVLIVGGLRFNTSGGSTRLVPVNEVEFFDPLDGGVLGIVDGVRFPRVEATAAAVRQGEFVAVAGGHDGIALKEEVVVFSWNGTGFRQVPQFGPPRIATPGRRAADGVTFRDGIDMLMLGGYTDITAVKPIEVPFTEIIRFELQGREATVARGGDDIGKRGELCAVTLRDGSVLTVGGRTADVNGMMVRSDDTVGVIRPDGRGGTMALGAPSLPLGRYLHTCTLMADGSVFVTGGLNETAANPTGDVLTDAWIYTPAPAD